MLSVRKDRSSGVGRRTYQSKSFSDTRVHYWHILDFLIFEVSESTIGISKHSLLFLVQCLTDHQPKHPQYKKRPTRHLACGRCVGVSMKRLPRRYVDQPSGWQSSYVRYPDWSTPCHPCRPILEVPQSYLRRAASQPFVREKQSRTHL